jgi:4-amino-4-deoxy-L-arabinose transferase-like glycosyltransferase
LVGVPDSRGGVLTSRQSSTTLWLVAVILAGLLIRLWLWRYRWINPDEGAHLMDGKLVLQGLVPIVDFRSRQVLYTYILAGSIALLGSDYALIRLVVVLTSLATTYVVFSIARRLFGPPVGLLAAGIYVSLPLAIVWGPIVHMEPFASLAACLAMYVLLRHLEPGGTWRSLLLAGGLFGVGFYVRESTLAVTFAGVCALVVYGWREPAHVARRLGVLLGGFLVPCLALAALYARLLTPLQWWQSSLNPLSVVLAQVGKVAGPTAPAEIVVGQPWAKTQQYFHEIVGLNAYLVVGAGLSLLVLLVAAAKHRDRLGDLRLPYALLYPWVGGLGLVYGYWSLHRGLFPQYSEEFLPPLAILLAFVIARLFTQWTGAESIRWGSLGLALWAVAAFVTFRLVPRFEPSRLAYLAVPAVALGWWQLGGRAGWRRWLGSSGVSVLGLAVVSASSAAGGPAARVLRLLAVPAIVALIWLAGRASGGMLRARSFPAYLGLVLVAAAIAYSFGAAASVVRPDYETPWSPGTVREVVEYIRAHSEPGDEVMSGGVMWEFQANRRPFADISHPLEISVGGLPPEKLPSLRSRWTTHPPRIVVLDGYTERTYSTVLPDFARSLNTQYTLADSVAGSRYTVRVYRLREAAER